MIIALTNKNTFWKKPQFQSLTYEKTKSVFCCCGEGRFGTILGLSSAQHTICVEPWKFIYNFIGKMNTIKLGATIFHRQQKKHHFFLPQMSITRYCCIQWCHIASLLLSIHSMRYFCMCLCFRRIGGMDSPLQTIKTHYIYGLWMIQSSAWSSSKNRIDKTAMFRTKTVSKQSQWKLSA